MSELLRAVILGIIQGLTEFLPVSSSGHLELAQAILGKTDIGDSSLLFTIVVHFATALATLIVFRKDVAEIVTDLFRKRGVEARKFAFFIILSMIPAAVIGFTMEPLIEQLFQSRVGFVGSMLLVTAVLLYLADLAGDREGKVGWKQAILIGLAQAVALLPGISRSGATIATSLMLGIDRYRASRFSFLMVVPLIIGKIGYDLISGDLAMQSESILPLGLGFLAALVSGILACNWMVALVRRSKLKYFAWYCALVGMIAIIWSLT